MNRLTKGSAPRRGLWVVMALMLMLVLAACSTAGTTPSLTDGVWTWQDWTDASGTTTVPNPENYTLDFATDGTFSGMADCNSFSGTYTQDGDTFTIVPGPTTLMACPEGSLDSVYTQTLAQVGSGEINANNELILTTADGLDMRFTNPTAAAAPAQAGGFLGLPWWAWLLLLLLLGLILWWLFSRGDEPEPEPVMTRTVTPPPVAPVVTAPVVTERVVDVVPDDLTRIEGIGPRINEILQAAGINTFAELATASEDELRRILEAAGLSGSFGDPTTWGEQARLADRGDWTALEALQDRLKGGRT